MTILATNDDGVKARGLWTLVGELRKIGRVAVAAPSEEQSAVGTAVSLRKVVRVQRVEPQLPDVDTYAVDGTPSDSVILALGRLVKDRVELVVSGINQGNNVGEDVHISGTVSAAMQAYLRGVPAMAISVAFREGQYLEGAARVAGILARRIITDESLHDIFLNVNLPERPLAEVLGAKVTRLAVESHINTVEEGGSGEKDYYRLVRFNVDKSSDAGTDAWAIAQGYISLTPLYTRHFDKSVLAVLNKLSADLEQELGIS